MSWITKLIKGKKAKKVEALIQEEEHEEEIIVKEAKNAKDEFLNGVGSGYIFRFESSMPFGVGNTVTENVPKELKNILAKLHTVDQIIADMRRHSKRIEKDSQTLLTDILTLRNAKELLKPQKEDIAKKILDYLSQDEADILEFTKNLNENLQAISSQIKLTLNDEKELTVNGAKQLTRDNAGKNIKESFKTFLERIRQLDMQLNGLIKKLVSFHELMAKIEEHKQEAEQT